MPVRRVLHLSGMLGIFLLYGIAIARPKKAAKTPEPAPGNAAAVVELPADINDASLRVNALDTIYEFDLSIEQLNALRLAASGTSAEKTRSPAKTTPQFVAALKNLYAALLDGKDDRQIASLRNDLLGMMDGTAVQLDDDLTVTASARAKSPALCQKLKASQFAAYLATHADEVSDPEELMMSTADELQEAASDPDEKPDTGDVATDATIHDSAFTVGYLVAGADESKAQSVAQQVTTWLANVRKMTNADFLKQRQSLEDSAKKIVADAGPVVVLNNWLERQIALMLSNPQLPEAIDAMLNARTH